MTNIIMNFAEAAKPVIRIKTTGKVIIKDLEIIDFSSDGITLLIYNLIFYYK